MQYNKGDRIELLSALYVGIELLEIPKGSQGTVVIAGDRICRVEFDTKRETLVLNHLMKKV